MSEAGATGFEPAIFGLTGRHVNRYTTPPHYARHYTTTGTVRQVRTRNRIGCTRPSPGSATTALGSRPWRAIRNQPQPKRAGSDPGVRQDYQSQRLGHCFYPARQQVGMDL